MTFRLVDVGYSLPFGQAVKLIFFAPCYLQEIYFLSMGIMGVYLRQRSSKPYFNTMAGFNWLLCEKVDIFHFSHF